MTEAGTYIDVETGAVWIVYKKKNLLTLEHVPSESHPDKLPSTTLKIADYYVEGE